MQIAGLVRPVDPEPVICNQEAQASAMATFAPPASAKAKNVENMTVGIAQTARFSKRQSTQRGDMISVSQVPPLHRRVSAVATDWEDLREVLLPIGM